MRKANYGRRIVRVRKGSSTLNVWSGQWVGHAYGNEFGSDLQRKRLLNACSADSVIAVSSKIFWGKGGRAGDSVSVADTRKAWKD